MESSKKENIPVPRKTKKAPSSNFSLFQFFILICFFPALFSTIILKLSGIKTIFWSERGTPRYPWVRGYIAVFLMVWAYMTIVCVLCYFFFFLTKLMIQKKDKNLRKEVGKYLLSFLLNQLVFNLSLFWLWKNRTKNTSIQIMLISFLLIILNSFFTHYFFCKPVAKLLIKRYPYYFPRFFYQETKLIMKVDGVKFEKKNTTEWAIMITLTLVNFWILSQLFYLWLFKI